MKKKIVSALLCATMVATMFAGCGSSGDSGDTPKDSSQASSDPAVSDSSDDGKSLISIAGMRSSRAVLQITILDMKK